MCHGGDFVRLRVRFALSSRVLHVHRMHLSFLGINGRRAKYRFDRANIVNARTVFLQTQR